MGRLDLVAWQKEIAEHFRAEIRVHFAAEEQVLFPVARGFAELASLAEELLADHAWLRERFARAEACNLSAKDLPAFAMRLSAHIRKEERLLFQQLQELMSEKELTDLGSELAGTLKEAAQACILPTGETKLRPAK